MHGRETFIVRAGDDGAAPRVASGEYAWVDPDEPAEHGRLVALWEDGEDSATLVRLLVVEDGRRILRALDEGWPEIEVTRLVRQYGGEGVPHLQADSCTKTLHKTPLN